MKRRRASRVGSIGIAGCEGGVLADCRGQATVEAAYLIPVVFLLLLLLIQPGILLYDRMVMESAAAEGCRLLATKTESLGSSDEACEAYIKRRLGAIPPQDQFHIHGGGCSWEIETNGGESSGYAEVTIRNKVKLLPLLDVGGTLLGLTGATGELSLETTVRMQVQPDWVGSSEFGYNPPAWVEKWA